LLAARSCQTGPRQRLWLFGLSEPAQAGSEPRSGKAGPAAFHD